MRIANEILMYFRAQKKLQNEVSINDTIDIDKDGNPLTYMDIISIDEDIAEEIDLKVHIERLKTLLDAELDEREKESAKMWNEYYAIKEVYDRAVAKYTEKWAQDNGILLAKNHSGAPTSKFRMKR